MIACLGSAPHGCFWEFQELYFVWHENVAANPMKWTFVLGQFV